MPYYPPAGAGTVTSVSSADASLTVTNSTTTPDVVINPDWISGFAIIDGYFTTSASSNILTIAIKNKAGNDPSSGVPVKIAFRNATAATGDFTILTLTGATSLTISAGSKLGSVNTQPFRIWVVGFNDGGTFRLGAINCFDGNSGLGATIYPLRNDILASSTAEGGAGGAGLYGVIYTGSAVTSKPMTILGYIDWESGVTTAGNWENPSKIQPFTYGISLPGQVIQQVFSFSNAEAHGSTTLPIDDTIPQSSEGTLYFTANLTANSKANIIKASALVSGGSSGSCYVGASLFFDTETGSRRSIWNGTSGPSANVVLLTPIWLFQATSTSQIAYKLYVAPSTGTFTLNGAGSARFFGGVMYSHLLVEEIMG